MTPARRSSASLPLLSLVGASGLLWFGVGLTRSRFSPAGLAWLADPVYLRVALWAQFALLGAAVWVLAPEATSRALRWLWARFPSTKASLVLFAGGGLFLALGWAWPARACWFGAFFALLSWARRVLEPEPEPSRVTDAEGFFTSWVLVSGLAWLLLVFALLGVDGHQKRDDLLGYFLALGAVPLLVAATHHRLREHASGPAVLRGVTLAVFGGLCLLWLLPFAPVLVVVTLGVVAGGVLPVVNLRARHALSAEQPLGQSAERALGLLPAALVLVCFTFHPAVRNHLLEGAGGSLAFYLGGALGFGLAWQWVKESRLAAPAVASWKARGLAAAAIVGAVALLHDVNLAVDTSHYGAYLGPANAVLGGRVPLVDAHCQYGLSYLVYSLAFSVLPRSYAGAGLITSLMTLALYATVLASALRLTRSRTLSLGGGILALVTFPALLDYNVNITPSVAGLRFFPFHLMLLALLCLPEERSFSPWTLAATALCALWSLEGLLFGPATYGFFLCARTLIAGEGRRALGIKLGGVLAVAALPHLALALALRALAGVWPRYSDSLGMVGAHLEQGEWVALLDPENLTWVPVVLAYLGISTLTVRAVFAARTAPRPLSEAHRLGCLFLVAALGTAELSIFATRAYWSLLVTVMFPAVILGLALIQRGLRSPLWRTPTTLGLLFTLPLCVAFTADRFCGPYASTGSNSVLARALVSNPAALADGARRPLQAGVGGPEQNLVHEGFAQRSFSEPLLAEGFALLERWASDEREVLLFTPHDTPLLFLSGRLHRYALSNPVNDDLSRPLKARLLASDVGLRAGELVFVAKDTGPLRPLQLELLRGILEAWRLEPVHSGEEMEVYRLEPRSPGPIPPEWEEALRDRGW